MPKYSTGDSASQPSAENITACELCGEESSSLHDATVAGAELTVCTDCNPHDDSTESGSSNSEPQDTVNSEPNDSPSATKSPVESGTYLNQDSSHWEEEGTNYEDDPLPYMVSAYGEKLQSARRSHDVSHDELATTIGVTPHDIKEMEAGQIRESSIRGSEVAELEKQLEIQLSEEP